MTINLIFKGFRFILDFFLDFWIPIVFAGLFCFFTGISPLMLGRAIAQVAVECTGHVAAFLTDPHSLENVRHWMREMIF